MIVFKGEEKPAKEWECVLIYDEATQTFTLEKLDSLVNLNFDGKALPRTRTAASRTFHFPAEPSCVHAYTMLTWHPVSLHSTHRLVLLKHPPTTRCARAQRDIRL